MTQVESDHQRENHTVLPGLAVELGSESSATTYIILSGKEASISRKRVEGEGWENPQRIPIGETFKVKQGEAVTLFNHWGRTPVFYRALRDLKTQI